MLTLWTMPNMAVGVEKDHSYMRVFQVSGTAGIIAYCFAFIPNAIWFQAGWRSIVNNIFDGVVFGLATGAVFGGLWPHG